MSIKSVVNDTVTSESVINALKPLPPTIISYTISGLDDTALDPAGGQTVLINGTGFLPGATITFDGSAVSVVTYVNATQLSFTTPAKSAGTYTIYVVNSDGGTAIYIPGIIYSTLPSWTTTAGTLGSYYETTNISNTVVASGDAPVTYSLFSGSLPTGASLAANGVITGSAPVDSSSTTYSFTIQATDAQLQDSTRSFSLTINTDVVTWVSPANATTYTNAVDSPISNVVLSATDAAGYAVSYSANALPTGLSLTGSNIAGTPTVIADSSTLLTATAATTNRTAVRTINWSITVANDPYFEYNTLLIPGASTTFVDDASTNNFAVTINGDTKPNNFNPYTPGYYSNYFDGSSGSLASPQNATFNLSTGDWTIEAWFNSSSIMGQSARYITITPSAGAVYGVLPGNNAFILNQFGTSSPITTSIAPTLNAWQHIALVKNGSTTTLYINGVAGGSATVSWVNADTTIFFGGNSGSYAYDYTGYISNARIVKGTAVYTANFTPATTPLTAIANTALLTCQSNRFIDNSTNNFTLTKVGNPKISGFIPFTPNNSYSTYGSGYFDGTGDYLTSTLSALGSGDFTIEYWIYPTADVNQYIFVLGTNWGDATGVQIINYSGQLSMQVGNASSIALLANPAINIWYHHAVVRSGSSVKFYVNGVASAVTLTTSTNLTATAFKLGYGTAGSWASFIGYMSDLRITTSAVYTTTFTPPSAPLTAIANTSLLVLQNNQSVNNNVFLDNSTNNFFVTRNGNTTQGTFSPYGGNWSNYFDGSGDYLTVPSNAALNFGTGDFTIEAWVYPNSLATDWFITSSIGIGGLFFGYRQSSAPQGFGWGRAGVAWDYVTASGTSNVWQHVALTRSGTSMRLFVNGTQVGTTQTLATAYDLTTTNTSIGSQGTSYYLNGNISNLRVVKGTAVYTAAFTPSTTPLTVISGTSLLTCQSNRIVDNSINNFTITKNGDVSVQRFSPFNPSSLTPTSYSGYFDGTGDYLNVASNAAFAFGTSDFTLEFWAYPTVNARQDWLDFDSGGGYRLLVYYDGSNIIYYSNGSRITGSAMTLNTWQHIAVVRNSGSTKLYINGSQSGSTYSDSINFLAQQLTIAKDNAGSTYVTGYMSNVRVVKGVAVYTGTFTVPTSPLQATQSSGTNIAAITGTSTSLLTLQSSTFIDNSTNNFTITATGNSQPRQQNPFGYTSATTNGYTVSTIGGSGYFDGTGDYLSIPANSAQFSPGTNNLTAEGWFYFTNLSAGVQNLFGSNNGSGTTQKLMAYVEANGTIHFDITQAGGASQATSAAGTVTNNVWYHLAFVRNAGTAYIYVNGVSVASGAATGNLSALTNPFYIGYIGEGYGVLISGYISNFRYVKGTALYTSNFVPPSAPLTAVQNTALLTNMTSAGVYDAAMMNNMETVGDAKLSTAVSKFGGSSMYFDGSGDYLLIPSTQFKNFAFGTGDFTIECWLYQTAFSGDTVITASFTTWATSVNFYFGTRAGTPNILIFRAGDSTPIVINGNTGITANTWTHVAVARASGITRLFVGGVLQTSSVTSSANISATTQSMGIGAANNGSEPITGYLDDLRITKGYARYTSNFSVPATGFLTY